MARPTNKKELLAAANTQFQKMWDLINSLTLEEQNKNFDFGKDFQPKQAHWTRDKNIRDVLAHLYEWHELLLNWTSANKKGKKQAFLPAPYNWRTYGEMNLEFWQKHQNTSYDEMKNLVEKSHQEVMKMIETFSDEELFSKNIFDWTGNSTLGGYCVSTTSSHYDWAIKKIKKHKQTLKMKAT